MQGTMKEIFTGGIIKDNLSLNLILGACNPDGTQQGRNQNPLMNFMDKLFTGRSNVRYILI